VLGETPVINLLYLIAMAACVYSGFALFSWWAVLLFGVVFALLFYMLKPEAFSIGARAGGPMYFVRFLAMNAILAVPLFGFGRLLAQIFK
jgi:hypothetical protein